MKYVLYLNNNNINRNELLLIFLSFKNTQYYLIHKFQSYYNIKI